MVLSPAKLLDYESVSPSNYFTEPEFKDKTFELLKILKGFSPNQLVELMGISDNLAQLNFARYSAFSTQFTLENSKQAIFAFNGDVYEGLQAQTLSEKDLKFAQAHLRILSGLYGLLRPLDLMQPYRLEMGTALLNKHGKDLYAFWKPVLAVVINQLLPSKNDILVNLASQEYFNSLDHRQLVSRVLTCQFEDYKSGQYKVIGFYAKRARGLMARYIIQNNIDSVDQLKNFAVEGYLFSAEVSTENKWVYRRLMGTS
jgi:cytoplasmic iron level regulating protein YaaA (DUF328/UPF0246 family)